MPARSQRRRKRSAWPHYALLLALLSVTGCSLFDEPFELETTVPGLVQASARDTDFRAYNALEAAVRADGQAVLATRVEFSEAARSNGIDLLPTRVALINAGGISQPLVAADPLIALEFPQPILIYTADEERIIAGYNTSTYLAERYAVADLPALAEYEERWQRFTQTAASDGELVGPGPGSVLRHEGIVEVELGGAAGDAFRLLNRVVREREDLQTVARYDHTVEGGPEVLTLLVNQPETSARIASAAQTAAIDVLLRLTVYETEAGTSRLAYVSPSYKAVRHDIADAVSADIATLQTILDEIVAAMTDG